MLFQCSEAARFLIGSPKTIRKERGGVPVEDHKSLREKYKESRSEPHPARQGRPDGLRPPARDRLAWIAAVCLIAQGAAAMAVVPALPAEPEPRADVADLWSTRIEPVLADRCLRCHGGADRVKAGLDLATRASMLRGGDSGPAIVPGDAAASLLLQAVSYDDPDLAMPPDEPLPAEIVADFERWITSGAPVSNVAADRSRTSDEAEPSRGDPDDARPWAFRPIADPTPPVLDAEGEAWALDDLDRFVYAAMRAKSLRPAPDADRRSWIRRVTFDLIGLPPTPDEVGAFLADETPDAHARVVDRLLASRHYGERQGRHWLDVARYADTAGDSSDYPIPQARRYRDWVIDAMNDDLPFAEFVRSQIAGDILAEREGARGEAYADRVTATGYLALSRRFGVGVRAAPHLVIEDSIDTLGRSMLGLTLRCARCHDHKFDPVSTRDYYGLYGIFASTRYPFPGSENQRYPADLVPLVPRDEAEPALAAHRKSLAAAKDRVSSRAEQLEKLRAERDDANERTRALERLVKRHTEAAPGLPTEGFACEMTDARIASRRSELDAERIELGRLRVAFELEKKAHEKAKRAQAASLKTLPDLPLAYAVVEAKPRDVPIQKGGEPRKKGEVVPRGFPAAIRGESPPEIEAGSGRLELAEWLVSDENPLPARVLVNRVWYHHFGRGLVASLDNFGELGRPPTHPGLLDWLASRFRESGGSRKALHRRIALSRTYRQASVASAKAIETDPENRWLSHGARRRLDAESIRDAVLAVSGTLDRERGAAHPFPALAKWNWTQHNPFRAVYPTRKRSVYVMRQRIRRHPYFGMFDGADTNACTAGRATSNAPNQALWFLNGELVHTAAKAFAKRLLESAHSADERVQLAYQRAYGRPATAEETDRALAHILRCHEVLATKPDAGPARDLAAWSSLARVMLAANEFVVVD